LEAQACSAVARPQTIITTTTRRLAQDSLDPNPRQHPQQAAVSSARQQHQLRLQARQVDPFSAAHLVVERNLRLEILEAVSLAELLQSLQPAVCSAAASLQTNLLRLRAEADCSEAVHQQHQMQVRLEVDCSAAARLQHQMQVRRVEDFSEEQLLNLRSLRLEERVCLAVETTMLARVRLAV
jgi:hypothetical protein